MRLFSRRKSLDVGVVLTSELHDQHSFYERLLEDMEFATKSVYIESPFISSTRGISLLPYFKAALSRGVKITILTRNPTTHDVESSYQAGTVVLSLRKMGAKVRYSSPHHHRKLAIIDDKIMYEGSLNILSHVRSEEMMRRFDSAEMVAQTRKYLRI